MNKTFLNNKYFFFTLVSVLSLIIIIISYQSYYAGKWFSLGSLHSNYNNNLIFKASATHLISGLDLYILHPSDHYDLYKYSPFFAMIMIPFTFLPDYLGIIIWNMINLFWQLYF